MNTDTDRIALVAASDTEYEFHTPAGHGQLLTTLSADLARHTCACAAWNRQDGCAHVAAARRYIGECITIEQMYAEEDGDGPFPISEDEPEPMSETFARLAASQAEIEAELAAMIYAELADARRCPYCREVCAVVRGEVEDALHCAAHGDVTGEIAAEGMR